MMRMRNLIWLLLVAALGYGTYAVKYRVQGLDEELARTLRQIRDDEDSLHVLKAEWSFLNQPARLDELAQRHLQLGPIATRQLGLVAAVPMRATPQRPASEPAAFALAPAAAARTASASLPARKPAQGAPASPSARVASLPSHAPAPSAHAPARIASASASAQPVKRAAAVAPAATPSFKPQFASVPLPRLASPHVNVASAGIRSE